MEKIKEDIKCFVCQNTLTKEEMENYFKNSKYCCDGHMCGCRGMPIEAPICNECSKEFEVEIIE